MKSYKSLGETRCFQIKSMILILSHEVILGKIFIVDFFAKSTVLSVQKTFLNSPFKHNYKSFVVIYEAPYASFNHCDDDTADHYDDDDDDEDDNDDIGECI